MTRVYINNCFWTFPTVSEVTAGQMLDFSVVIPPPVAIPTTTPVSGTTTQLDIIFPVSGSSISWSLQDTSGQELTGGVHYKIVDGGLASDHLSVVFNPPAKDSQEDEVKVFPTLSLFYAGASAVDPDTKEATPYEKKKFDAKTFTLKPQVEAVNDVFFDQCFWTYPQLDSVPAGRALDFRVVIPPPTPPAPGVPGFPLTGATVTWSIVDASTSKEMTPGKDYLITQGGLGSELLSVVFSPVAKTSVKVSPKLTLFYDNFGGPVTGALPGKTYTLDGAADLKDKLTSQLAKAVALATDTLIVEPGEPVNLRIVPAEVLDIPQVVTSLLHETPKVRIRGAIPLDSLVEALLQPVKGVFGQFVPGSKPSLDEAELEVRKLLGGLFSIPLALDVQGDRLTKTLAPAGTPEIPLFSPSPDGRSLAGVIPIGSWPATFNVADVKWTVGGKTEESSDLSPGMPLLKSFLLRPDIVQLSSDVGKTAPTPVTITAVVSITVTVNSGTTFDITLPALTVTLQRLPLPLPQIGAVFKHDFYNLNPDEEDPQAVYLTTDKQTAPFLASQSDCLNYIARLTGVLNKIVAVGTSLGTDWGDFLGLATGLGYLSEQIARVKPENVFFQPCLTDEMKCINLRNTDFNDAISAIISVGVPSSKAFVVYDNDSNLAITLGRYTYYSILPDLTGPFKDVKQIPAGCADSTDSSYDLNDRLEILGYGDLFSP